MTDDRSEAIRKGMAQSRERGRRMGRKPKVSDAQIKAVIHMGTTDAAKKVKLSKSRYIARRRAIEERENDDE